MKMKQKLIIILSAVVLVGCGSSGEYTGREIRTMSLMVEKCFNGVVYYNGIAPAFKPDGSLYTCENKIKEN